MAETLKVLGQSSPAAATLTDMYTVPASTSAVVSTLQIANRTNGNVRVRTSVAVSGAADAPEQYLLYDQLVLKQDSLTLTIGMTLAATDVVRVRTDTLGVSFNLFGTEVT